MFGLLWAGTLLLLQLALMAFVVALVVWVALTLIRVVIVDSIKIAIQWFRDRKAHTA